MLLRASVAFTIALAGIAVVAVTVAHGNSRTASHQIAYSRYRFVDSPLRREIWVANPDGGGQRRLTKVEPNVLDSSPDWSPDHSRIVFTRCLPEGSHAQDGRCTIWAVAPDGTGVRMLSAVCPKSGGTCDDNSSPRYSSDGRRIAFGVYEAGSGFGIADSNLRHARLFFPFGQSRAAPDVTGLAWSPDGKLLALSVYNDNGKRFKPVNGRAIFTVRPDGSGLHRVTSWRLRGGGPIDWSPDGRRILFQAVVVENDDPGPSIGDLYTIRADGSELRRVTHFPAGTSVQLGSYSSDGTSIVFVANAGAVPKPTGGAWPDVFVMNADGTRITAVTQTRNWEGSPAFG